jgi:hypothetical protein
LDESLRESVLAGDFNLVRCPECEAVFYLETTIVYHDPPAGLTAFVFPESYAADEARWRGKMKEDHGRMTESLGLILGEPVLLFGLEALRDLLSGEDGLEDEVRVAGHFCSRLGLAMRPVDRAFARERKLPRLVPFMPGKASAQSGLAALGLLLEADSALEGYRRWEGELRARGLPPLEGGGK